MEIREVNHGYLEPKVKEQDYRFGSGQVSLYYPIQLDSDWTTFLPRDEDQNLRGIETSNCTAFAITNQIEAFMKNKFGIDANYSDRFLGLMAGTRPPGNDPNVVYEAVRKYGLIPEEMCPFSDDIQSVDDYFSWKGVDKEACIAEGKNWLSKYMFLHDWVADGIETTPDVMKTALQYSPLCGAVYAWAFDGIKYIRMGNDSHWTMFFKVDDFIEDFDSYDPNRKNLDLNFGFKFVKRIHIEPADINQKQQTWIIQQIIALYQKILEILKNGLGLRK